MLEGKKILLGITGSIAAYKSAVLIRLMVKSGAEVRVVTTPSAGDFITPLTLATLSKNPVLSQFSEDTTGVWNNHVELGLWADLMVIAPATANTISKMANGICDNLLLATYLSARCPVLLAPAMDLDMLEHPSTQRNLNQLKTDGVTVLDTNVGELASGLIGSGRMAEPEEVHASISAYFSESHTLINQHVLITAGPTYEPIDPVRFVGNYSTGNMGYYIAETMAQCGAKVTLVSGPTQLSLHHPNIQVVKVRTADEMYDQCSHYFPKAQIAILTAAVSDYKPAQVHTEKIKKHTAALDISMLPTPDIAAQLGKQKKVGQFIVGFALETENEIENAQAKLVAKNFDMIVLNSLKDQGAGFGRDTNKVTIIDKDNNTHPFSLKHKREVARDIVQYIIEHHKKA